MGASDYRMSNATKYTVEFIISGKNLELKTRKTRTERSLEVNASLSVQNQSVSIPFKAQTKIDNDYETENIIEAKYPLGPGATTLITLQNISQQARLTIIGRLQNERYVLRESVKIPSDPLLGGRLVVYEQDNCFRIGNIVDGKNWLMQKGNSGSTTQRNYPPGITCEYCHRSRACTQKCRLSTFYYWKYANRWREGDPDYNGPAQ